MVLHRFSPGLSAGRDHPGRRFAFHDSKIKEFTPSAHTDVFAE